jgi:menaquinone-specific isochorismate synthase
LSSRFSPLRVQAPSSVTTSFSDLLAAAAEGARQLDGEGVLSLALPLAGRDPAGLVEEARRLGYSGQLPERQERLQAPGP